MYFLISHDKGTVCLAVEACHKTRKCKAFFWKRF